MTYKFIEIEQENWITHIKIRRPERHNALGPLLYDELRQLSDELFRAQAIKSNDHVEILLITSETTKPKNSTSPLWIAGGDLKELANLPKLEGQAFFANMRALKRLWRQAPFLVVTWIDGLAIGGGAEFALYGDYRIMANHGALQFKQLDIGLPLGFLGTEALVELVGLSAAQRLLFAGEILNTSECLHLGLVHTFSGDKTVAEVKKDLRRRFEHYSSSALHAQKQMLYPSTSDNVVDARELDLFFRAWRNPLHDSILKKFETPKPS